MPAGQLRHRLRFQRRAVSDDGAGNKVTAWADIPGLTDWAGEIKPVRGGEDLIAMKVQGTGVVQIRVRACAETLAVTVQDRVLDARNGRAFNIRYIENPDMRERYLTMTCEFGVADG